MASVCQRPPMGSSLQQGIVVVPARLGKSTPAVDGSLLQDSDPCSLGMERTRSEHLRHQRALAKRSVHDQGHGYPHRMVTATSIQTERRPLSSSPRVVQMRTESYTRGWGRSSPKAFSTCNQRAEATSFGRFHPTHLPVGATILFGCGSPRAVASSTATKSSPSSTKTAQCPRPSRPSSQPPHPPLSSHKHTTPPPSQQQQ